MTKKKVLAECGVKKLRGTKDYYIDYELDKKTSNKIYKQALNNPNLTLDNIKFQLKTAKDSIKTAFIAAELIYTLEQYIKKKENNDK